MKSRAELHAELAELKAREVAGVRRVRKYGNRPASAPATGGAGRLATGGGGVLASGGGVMPATGGAGRLSTGGAGRLSTGGAKLSEEKLATGGGGGLSTPSAVVKVRLRLGGPPAILCGGACNPRSWCLPPCAVEPATIGRGACSPMCRSGRRGGGGRGAGAQGAAQPDLLLRMPGRPPGRQIARGAISQTAAAATPGDQAAALRVQAAAPHVQAAALRVQAAALRVQAAALRVQAAALRVTGAAARPAGVHAARTRRVLSGRGVPRCISARRADVIAGRGSQDECQCTV